VQEFSCAIFSFARALQTNAIAAAGVKSAMKTLLWFRNNLRLHDNPALAHAAATSRELIPLYIHDTSFPSVLPLTDLPEKGDFRKKALQEALLGLSAGLSALNSGLVVSTGPLETILEALFAKSPFGRIVSSIEPGTWEAAQQQTVERWASRKNIKTSFLECGALFDAGQLPYEGSLPFMFTDFRKKVEAVCKVQNAAVIAKVAPLPDALITETGAVPAKTWQVPDKRTAFPFEVSEKTALEHLSRYTAENGPVRTYKETRNGMLGTAYSTKFSPFLAHGVLSPRTVWHQISAHESRYGGNDSTYWVKFELLWREFFRHAMYRSGNTYFRKRGLLRKSPEFTGKANLFEAWATGTTGNPLVDAAMRELKFTGYLSNRARQNVASYFVHRLKLDWRLGAEYFQHQLIDYDAASNWGNWAYVAGVGNDPRAREFNLERQLQMYDPKLEYVKTWVEELGKVKAEEVFRRSGEK
jgi:deoxyribodipyrimidine photo-lyase